MEVIDKHLKEFDQINKLLDKKDIFSSERLFKCILGLNKTESKVLGYMLRNKDVKTSEIAEALKMDRSSIQRAVQDLSDLKLIERQSMSMKEYVEKELNKLGNQTVNFEGEKMTRYAFEEKYQTLCRDLEEEKENKKVLEEEAKQVGIAISGKVHKGPASGSQQRILTFEELPTPQKPNRS